MNEEILKNENNPKDEVEELKHLYEKNRDCVLELVRDGKLPEPRKLTRAERRRLDAAKVNIFKIELDDKRTYLAVKEDLADWIIENVYSDFNFDTVDNNICLWFGEYVFGLSYRNDLAVKN